MEGAKYTTKEAVQAIQELDFGEDICNINQYIKKRMQNNDISEIINMERQDISPAVYHMPQNSQPSSGLRNVQSVQMHRSPPTSGGPPI